MAETSEFLTDAWVIAKIFLAMTQTALNLLSGDADSDNQYTNKIFLYWALN
jgi:hypothetical protein